jgi:superfamily I DNA/RNA helicase
MFFGKAVDERAVFFVGISRAKNHLVLTYTETRTELPGVKGLTAERTPHEEFSVMSSPTPLE